MAAGQEREVEKLAWDAACRAWSRCDHSDPIEAMKLGETMMFAATDYIVALESIRDAQDQFRGLRGTQENTNA